MPETNTSRPSFFARAWFPLSLVGLLLLALPGYVLFALNRFGFEGEIELAHSTPLSPGAQLVADGRGHCVEHSKT